MFVRQSTCVFGERAKIHHIVGSPTLISISIFINFTGTTSKKNVQKGLVEQCHKKQINSDVYKYVESPGTSKYPAELSTTKQQYTTQVRL